MDPLTACELRRVEERPVRRRVVGGDPRPTRGFDGIEAATWVEPELTTIEQPIDEIASTAVDLLRSVIADPARSLPRVLLQPRLRAGGSTAVLATA